VILHYHRERYDINRLQHPHLMLNHQSHESEKHQLKIINHMRKKNISCQIINHMKKKHQLPNHQSHEKTKQTKTSVSRQKGIKTE
jgi:hypothetical protein